MKTSYRILDRDYTAKQVNILRKVLNGERIPTDRHTTIIIDTMKRRGDIRETEDGTLRATYAGLYIEEIFRMRESGVTARQAMSLCFGHWWNTYYSNPPTYHYRPPRLKTICKKNEGGTP